MPPYFHFPTSATSQHSSTNVQDILTVLSQELQELTILTNQLNTSNSTMTEEIQSLNTQNNSLRSMLENISHATSQSSISDETSQYDSQFQINSNHNNYATEEDITPTRSQTIDTNSSTGSRASTDNDISSANINNLGNRFLQDINNTQVDQLGTKQPGDFCLVFQNPNGMKIYQDGDPEYLPSIESLKNADVDMVCLAETNVPWHSNDFFYNVSKQNQITWNTIYKWLKMLRHQKEAAQQRKQHEDSNRISAQPITRWCDRDSGM